MASTTLRSVVGAVRRGGIGLTLVGLCLVLVGAPAFAQEAPSYVVRDIGVIPRPFSPIALVRMPPIRDELKLSGAQQKEQDALMESRLQKLAQARQENKDFAKFQEIRNSLLKQTEEDFQKTLTPEQRVRLEQIHIQLEGSAAFDPPGSGPMASPGPTLAQRLKLSDEQLQQIGPIVAKGREEIVKAASFPIALDTKQGEPTTEAIRAYVERPEFQESKQKARQASRDAQAAVIARIEAVLTPEQREAYHALRGAPFELKLEPAGPQDPREIDARMVAGALGLGGQRSDPSFDTKVSRPAYATEARHPRVLFDEGHNNFHTSSGRYKPFAALISSDGYQVIPNTEKFSRDVLRKGDILIIANALGAAAMGQAGASNSAFTDAECDAVRDWVKEGGSLLFITDHAPFGAAAEGLAQRLGVDLSKGATSDPAHSEGDPTWLSFSRENHLLGDHAITNGRDDSERVNRVRTFTGTSIKGPAGSVPILKLADTAKDESPGAGAAASAAGRAQGIAFRLGEGRVVVLGEAAELSAQVAGPGGEKFGMNVPGIDNRQMALNIMHWLSGVLEPRETAR